MGRRKTSDVGLYRLRAEPEGREHTIGVAPDPRDPLLVHRGRPLVLGPLVERPVPVGGEEQEGVALPGHNGQLALAPRLELVVRGGEPSEPRRAACARRPEAGGFRSEGKIADSHQLRDRTRRFAYLSRRHSGTLTASTASALPYWHPPHQPTCSHHSAAPGPGPSRTK